MAITIESSCIIHVSHHLDSGQVLITLSEPAQAGRSDLWGEKSSTGQALGLDLAYLVRSWIETRSGDQAPLPFD